MPKYFLNLNQAAHACFLRIPALLGAAFAEGKGRA